MATIRQFIIILIICISAKVQAQTTDNISLDWKDIQTFHIDESQTLSRLYFEDCYYEDLLSTQPYFSYNKEVAIFHTDYSIELLHPQYETVNAIEKLLLPSEISEEIQVRYQTLESGSQKYVQIQFSPFVKKENKIYKLSAAQLRIENSGTIMKKGKGNSYVQNSVLANGSWYKVRIAQTGMYKISAAEYAAMGFGSNVPVNKVRLYGNGGGLLPEIAGNRVHDDLVENAIHLEDLNNNQIFDNNDYFLFYGQGPLTWKYDTTQQKFNHQQHHYDDYAFYFVTEMDGNGKRVANVQTYTVDEDMVVNQFLDYQLWEKDSLNLIKSGRVWYGKKFDIQTQYSHSLNFPNINTDSLLKVKAVVAARSFSSSNMNIKVNGQSRNISMYPINGSASGYYAQKGSANHDFPASSSLQNITLKYNKPNNNSLAWLDYVHINAWRHLTMSGKQMSFTNPVVAGQNKLAEYQISNPGTGTRVWDVSNPLEPIEMVLTMKNTKITYKDSLTQLKRYCAFSGAYLAVENVGSVANQNLHSLKDIEYVIVTHPDFMSVAEKIKTFHEQMSGYKIYVTTPTPIYNEFSSGAKDVGAIRDFMKMLYDNALTNGGLSPRYLLLLGDGSYDNKNRLPDNTNYLLTFQSRESLAIAGSFTSDDYFALLSDNEGLDAHGGLDIGVGRFPVTTLKQAEEILAKIYRYTATHEDDNGVQNSCAGGSFNVGNMADWRNTIAFVGDDEDGMIHTEQANYLADYIHTNYPTYNVNKIFFDAYPQVTVPGGQRYPEAKRDLLQQVEKGALLVSYTGHGGEVGWAHESVLEVGNILDMSNFNNLPAFITATCEFSRFDDPERISAGEHVLLNPTGGGIALFTTTRLAYSGSNYALSRAFFKHLLNQTNGEYNAMGDLIRLAKNGSSNSHNNRNFILLGDPGLKLTYPKHDVVTTEINNQSVVAGNLDTLKALSLVTIKGQIESDGQLMSNFNGVVYPTIYDKAKDFYTLGQDQGSYAYPFTLQKNIIYKGKSVVENGKFEFTFIVPKDISYSYGPGKISYYAQNGLTDAIGAYDSIIIGGSSTTVTNDNLGPQISLFMNDSNFIHGGITNENPLLLAYLFDENGINTTGNGIGHDIVAILDGNTQSPIILNDYYEASLNSYQRGIVRYPFQNLSKGKHTLTIKVWDIYNNSSTASTEFYVEESNQMVISNLRNWPNPFSDQTAFVFEHNQACEEMEVEVYIYDMVGRLVDRLHGHANCEGFKVSSSLLQWDGTNDNGSPLAKGMYVYKLRVRTDLTDWTAASNKLIILR